MLLDIDYNTLARDYADFEAHILQNLESQRLDFAAYVYDTFDFAERIEIVQITVS